MGGGGWAGAELSLGSYCVSYCTVIITCPRVSARWSLGVWCQQQQREATLTSSTHYTPADASSRTLPAKCRGCSGHNIQYSALPAATAQQQQQKPGSRQQSIWFNGREEGQRGGRATGCCLKLPTKFHGTQFLENVSSHLVVECRNRFYSVKAILDRRCFQ